MNDDLRAQNNRDACCCSAAVESAVDLYRAAGNVMAHWLKRKAAEAVLLATVEEARLTGVLTHEPVGGWSILGSKMAERVQR